MNSCNNVHTLNKGFPIGTMYVVEIGGCIYDRREITIIEMLDEDLCCVLSKSHCRGTEVILPVSNEYRLH